MKNSPSFASAICPMLQTTWRFGSYDTWLDCALSAVQVLINPSTLRWMNSGLSNIVSTEGPCVRKMAAHGIAVAVGERKAWLGLIIGVFGMTWCIIVGRVASTAGSISLQPAGTMIEKLSCG